MCGTNTGRLTLAEGIIFVEDYLREPTWQARRFVMELIAPAIREASGKNLMPLIDTVSEPQKIAEFCNLAPGPWEQHYYQLPQAAEDWLGEKIGSVSLAIGYETPVWMQSFLDKHNIPWVDIRLSPVRFSLDLMFAVRSNCPAVNEWLRSSQIPQETISLYATQNAASSKMYQRLQASPQTKLFDNNALVYIGQTAADAALVSAQGQFLTVSDFAEDLQSMGEGKHTIYYHPHPFAGEHAAKEIQDLADITGQEIKMTAVTTDRLLLSENNILLTGISSGLLQEAEYFGVRSKILYKPVCPLFGKDSYSQYYVNDLMAPGFWRNILSPGTNEFSASNGVPDRLRYLHFLWFSHGDFVLERGPEAVMRFKERSRVDQLEHRLEYLESVWKKISGNRVSQLLIFGLKRLSQLKRKLNKIK